MPRVKWNTLTALLPKSIHHLRSDSPVTDFGTYILECIIYVQAMTSYNLIMNCSLHHTGMKKFPNPNPNDNSLVTNCNCYLKLYLHNQLFFPWCHVVSVCCILTTTRWQRSINISVDELHNFCP